MDQPNHLDVGATLARLEEGVAPIPIELSLASLAISAKEISAQLALIRSELVRHDQKMDDLRYAINTVSSNGQQVSSAIAGLGGHFSLLASTINKIAQDFKGVP